MDWSILGKLPRPRGGVMALAGGGVAALLLLAAATGVGRRGVAHPALAHAARVPAVTDVEPELLYDGSVLAARDIPFLERRINLELPRLRTAGTPRAEGLRSTLQTLEAARAAHPQASLFTCSLRNGNLELAPASWRDQPPVVREEHADLVLVGGELGALSTAIAAADKGMSVAVVYQPPLGGVAADTGANQRYFDCMPNTPHPAAQRSLFHDGMGMGNWFGIPRKTDARLREYFQRAQSRRIRLIPTAAYDALHVERQGDLLQAVVTDEGTRVTGRYFIDGEPESRVAEKAGLPYSIDTPHLSYGLVFDIGGMTPADCRALRLHDRIQPDAILQHLGLRREDLAGSPRALEKLERLKEKLADDKVTGEGRCSFGYRALAQAFDFYQECRALTDSHPGWEWLNYRRMVSGFNVCQLGSTGTFNSISYGLRKNVLQFSHSLARDPEYAPIRELERPGLAEFFQYVTGNPELTARIPDQFYVRKSSAFFKVLHPYRRKEFQTVRPFRSRQFAAGMPPRTLFMLYNMDLRDLRPRDMEGWEVVSGYLDTARGANAWVCRASTCCTEVDNLFLLNRCGVTPAFSGGLRIEQNMTNTGAVLVDYLARKG